MRSLIFVFGLLCFLLFIFDAGCEAGTGDNCTYGFPNPLDN